MCPLPSICDSTVQIELKKPLESGEAALNSATEAWQAGDEVMEKQALGVTVLSFASLCPWPYAPMEIMMISQL